jgi:uroporphyrinogen-III synthase
MPRTASRPILSGWYVLSLRPLREHGPVRRAAARLGARCVALSTQALEPVPAGRALAAALACRQVLVTSPAAVRAAATQAGWRPRRNQDWFALGAASARALVCAGVAAARVHLPVGGHDSEGLLARAELQDVRGQAVGLLTAPGGRGLLARTLAGRGAALRIAEVYRRLPRPPAPARLRALSSLDDRGALLFTSDDALAPLWQALPAAERTRWQARPCVVASDRLAARARALGFHAILRAAGPAPAQLLEALAAHVRAQRFR